MPRTTKDWDWGVSKDATGSYAMSSAHLSVLMDIRDELKVMNQQMRDSGFCNVKRNLDRLLQTANRVDRRLAKKISLRKPSPPSPLRGT